MQIRPYTEADLDAVIALFTAAVHQGAAADYTAEQRAAWAPMPPERAVWQQRLGETQVLLATDAAALAGFVGWRDNGHIVFLFTHPDQLRKGVASALYLRVEAALRQQGVTRLYTEASRVARPFFARQGFHQEAAESVLRNGVTLPRFRMVKAIAAASPARPAAGSEGAPG